MYTLCDDSVGTRDNNVSGHSIESGLGISMSGLATWRRHILIEMQMDVCPLVQVLTTDLLVARRYFMFATERGAGMRWACTSEIVLWDVLCDQVGRLGVCSMTFSGTAQHALLPRPRAMERSTVACACTLQSSLRAVDVQLRIRL